MQAEPATSLGLLRLGGRRGTGVKVFTSMVRDGMASHHLGDDVTQWMAGHPHLSLTEVVVTQSTERHVHCVAITLFYVADTRPAVPAALA